MPVRMVASQSKMIFFAELCFVCAGWCFLLLFMHFFQPVLGRSFLDSNRSDNPGKHTVHDKILDEVIETGKGQKVKEK